MNKAKPHFEIIVTIALFLLLCCIGLSTNTTGESGDSILHFLYSKYSFSHPELFLNHWAKPVFVLLSSPFSQFGFKGIIVFNCLVVSLTGLFTYWTAKNLKLNYPWLVFLLILFCPLFLKLIFSGLTEYLFGLFLIISIYLTTKEKYVIAALIISFLPFVRSEGLIIAGVFGIFFLFQKKSKLALVSLSAGHMLYSIVGCFYYKDILWVFTKIPYNSLTSPYGSGHLFDFVHRLNYVIEKPIYLLLFIGFVSISWRFIKPTTEKFNSIIIILVFGSFFIFFIAHSLFWWLGIFNSMGLPRVLISVVPAIALIATIGFNFILSFVKSPTIKNIILITGVLIVISYPFTNRAEGVVFSKSLLQIPDNELIDNEVTPYLQKNIEKPIEHLFYYSDPYLSISLNIDHFDNLKHREMHLLSHEPAPPGSIIIWDDWFSVVEEGISLDELKNNKNLKFLKEFSKQDGKRLIKFAVFQSTAN